MLSGSGGKYPRNDSAFIASAKDRRSQSAVQWKAGRFLAVELLRANASGKEDLSEIALKWLPAP